MCPGRESNGDDESHRFGQLLLKHRGIMIHMELIPDRRTGQWQGLKSCRVDAGVSRDCLALEDWWKEDLQVARVGRVNWHNCTYHDAVKRQTEMDKHVKFMNNLCRPRNAQGLFFCCF